MPGHIRQHTLCMFVAWSIAQLSDHSAVTAAGDTAPLLSWQRICAGCWQRGYAGCRERGHDQGHSSGERADRVHLVTLSSPRPQVVVACSQRAPQSHSWRVLLMCASPHVLNYEQSCLTPAAGLREKHKHHSKHHSADCARPAERVETGAPGTKNVCLNLAASTSSVSRKVACSPTHFRAFTAFTAPPPKSFCQAPHRAALRTQQGPVPVRDTGPPENTNARLCAWLLRGLCQRAPGRRSRLRRESARPL